MLNYRDFVNKSIENILTEGFENNAVRKTGTPFHPGAIKFYKEIGIWSE